MKLYPAPPRLYPIAGEPENALDLLPITPDPSGRGARAWEILSRLTITEGEFAGRKIGDHSPPWQERLTKLLFGHVDKSGMRMLREAFVTIGKKNGKTSYAAALSLTALLLEEEERQQVLFLAATRDQAKIAFDAMAAMILADPVLEPKFQIVEHRATIRYPATRSYARAISAELASIVGLNPSFTTIDELHLLGETPKGQKLVSQVRTGSVSRRQPLMLSISTKPIDRSAGIFESTLAKARRIVAGKEDDPRFMGWLCEIPPGLDPENPANWHWSNPSINYTITLPRLQSDFGSARSDPASLRDFRSQNLNVDPETSAGIGKWLPLDEWDAAADPGLTLETIIAEADSIYAGVDAGGLDDLSAIAVLGHTADDRYLLWTAQWLARRGYDKRSAIVPYDDFIAADELEVFDGGDSDIDAIAEIAATLDETGKLRLIGIDSYGASELAAALKELAAETVSVPQNWRLTPAITWVERRLAEGTLTHHGSKLLRLNIDNATVTRAGNGRSITKATAVGSGKIDGVAAMLNAVASLLEAPAPVDIEALIG